MPDIDFVAVCRSPALSHLLPPAPPVREDSLSLPVAAQTNSAAAAVSEPPLLPTPTTPPPPPLPQYVPAAVTPGPVPSTTPTYTRVVLERGSDGLGFSIVGGKGNPQGDLPIFVKTVRILLLKSEEKGSKKLRLVRPGQVFERGAAAQSGRLRPGDQIHAVDDILMEGKTHQEAVALLKNAKGTVVLTIVS